MRAGHLHFKDVPKLGGPPGLSWHIYELPCFLTGQIDRSLYLSLPVEVLTWALKLHSTFSLPR